MSIGDTVAAVAYGQTSLRSPNGKTVQYDGPETLQAGKWILELDYSGLALAGIVALAPLKKLLPTVYGGENNDRAAGFVEQAFAEGLTEAINAWQKKLAESTDGGSVMSVRPTKTEIVWQTVSIPGEDGSVLEFKAPQLVRIEFEVRSLIIGILLVVGFLLACNQLFPEATKATIRQAQDVVGSIGDGIGSMVAQPLGAIALPVALAIGAFILWVVWSR